MSVLTRWRPTPLTDPSAQALDEIAALDAVLGALDAAADEEAGVAAVLDAIRRGFGFDYGAAWAVPDAGDELELRAQSGSMSAELTRMTVHHRVTPGLGLCGIAWQTGEVIDVPDAQLMGASCARGRAALAAGARGAMSFPVQRGGRTVMVLDFCRRTVLEPSPTRAAVTAALARAVSQTLATMHRTERLHESSRDQQAVTTVVAEVGACPDEDSAVKRALDAVRAEFGWVYGSFWAIDDASRTLRFQVESGEAGAEFRQVTLTASFAEGVGLSGRAWRSRDLVFVRDLGELSDCVRAPAAQRAGVRSGVCLPILVGGVVVGTMDFFVTETIELSESRRGALRNVARLVSQRLEILRRAERERASASALLDTVDHLVRAATEAGAVADAAVQEASAMSREVEVLRESSAAIDEVIRVISTIADQTNLLALNATIEAARAGQAGRGFAVVATEVKELAGETTTATGRVGQRVAEIQSNTATVAEGIDAITRTIERMGAVQARIASVLEEQRAMARAFQDGAR